MWLIVHGSRQPTQTIVAWKRHHCAHCGAVFLYRFTREVAASSAMAIRPADDGLLRAALKYEVETHPCPSCGLLQPEMQGRARGRMHGLLIVLAIACGITISAIIASVEAPRLLLCVMAAAGAMQVAASWIGCSGGPARLDLARREMDEGILRLESGPRPLASPAASPLPPRKMAIAIFIAALALGTLLDAGLLWKKWPVNPEFDPPVFGPGDRVQVLFSHRSSRFVTTSSAGDSEADLQLVQETLRGRRGEYQDLFLVVRDVPVLSNATIELDDRTIQLGPRGIGAMYRWLWRFSFWGALLVHLFGAVLLWRSAHAHTGDATIEA